MTVQRKYLEMFLEEGAEILSSLNQRVLSLEAAANDPDALQSALRLSHTLKGGAKMVGLDNVSRAAHDVESTLKALTGGGEALTPEASTKFLNTLDRIQHALDLVARGREAEAISLDLAVPVAQVEGEENAGHHPAAVLCTPAKSEDGMVAPAGAAVETRLGADRVRVGVQKLDALQNLVDDLILKKVRIFDHVNQFRKAFAGLERVAGDAEHDFSTDEQERIRGLVRLLTGRGVGAYLEDLHELDQLVSEIQDLVFDLRMVPLAEVLDEYYRAVRDLARELKKDVALTIDGKFTEMDKRVLEAVQAPLMHLVRNAVDHGVEMPEERLKLGKSPTGQVTIRAYHKGSAVVLEVEDDGRGLDPDRIREKCVHRGLLTEEQAGALLVEEVYHLLCEPGFSTRGDVTELSGRGVGLDVVKVRVERLKGSLSIQSETGHFTRFRMTLPLSISTLSALVVRVGNAAYALPSLFVDGCYKVDSAELIAQSGTWTHAGRVLPVVSLARALGFEVEPVADRTCLVVVRFRARHMVLQLGGFDEERQVVLKSLGGHLREVPYVLGVTFLADGLPVPVLNVVELHNRWTTLEMTCRLQSGPPRGSPIVLVVDDSITTRHVERNVLESLGYNVIQAADGLEAWKILEGQRVDLVLTDIEMPRMDGLELSRRIRGSEATARLPVVAVSRGADEGDQEAGFLAGVDAYLCKDRFNQRELGETLRGLLGREN